MSLQRAVECTVVDKTYRIEFLIDEIPDSPMRAHYLTVARKSERMVEPLFISVTMEDYHWMCNYIRNKSTFLLPQIVDVFVEHIHFNKIKAELIKL